MMDFEELQKSWQSQPLTSPGEITAVQESVAGKWRKQQRGVLWSNIFTTIGFIAVFVVFGKIHIAFHAGRTILFDGSLVAMSLVMFVYLWVIWKGVALKKADFSAPVNNYLDHYLKTLHWRKKLITTYSWIYGVLLWTALMLYMLDVTHGGSVLFQAAAMGGTTAYIFGVLTITRYTSGRKKLRKIDELMLELEQLKGKMSE
jgi:hypothetical protein